MNFIRGAILLAIVVCPLMAWAQSVSSKGDSLAIVNSEFLTTEKKLRDISAKIEQDPDNEVYLIERIKLLSHLDGVRRAHKICCAAKDSPSKAKAIEGSLARFVLVENAVLAAPMCRKIAKNSTEANAYCQAASLKSFVDGEFSIERDYYRVLEINPNSVELSLACIEIDTASRQFDTFGSFEGCPGRVDEFYTKALSSRPSKELMTFACMYMGASSADYEQVLQYCHQAEQTKAVRISIENLAEEIFPSVAAGAHRECDDAKYAALIGKLKGLCPDLPANRSYNCEQAAFEEIAERRQSYCKNQAYIHPLDL